AERNQMRARDMYRFAGHPGCGHQRLVEHLGVRAEPCGTSCDRCVRSDVVAEAPTPPRGTRASLPGPAPAPAATAPAEALKNASLFFELKALRRRLADARGIPAYLVFSD